MIQPNYQIDEISKTLLTILQKCGRHKTFAEILVERELSNDKQDELANQLEDMGLIESVTFKLPFEIRAELSMAGEALVDSFRKVERRKPAPAPHAKPSSRRGKAKAALDIEEDL
jgi:DNA-binding Lrp family transcriptional regulator